MSLQARLLAGVALVGLVLVVAALVITRTTESYLVGQVDEQLRAAVPPGRAPALRDRFPGPGVGEPIPVGGFNALYVGFVDADGTLRTLAEPTLRADPLPPPEVPAELVVAPGVEPGTFLTVGSEGSDLRYRIQVLAQGPEDGILVIGLPLDGVDAAVSRLVRVVVVATALIVAVVAVVAWWVIRLGVRPIKQMTATAGAIAGGDLSRRAPEGVPGVEASDLAAALNRMLARIQEAFDQRTLSEDKLRQFVADASHELRTPVATIRGYAELYRTGALEEPGELDQAMRRTEQEAVRMGELVDDLLLLARLDQGRPLGRERVDLAVVAADVVGDAAALDPARPVTLDVAGPVVVVGDDGRLRQVLGNAVRNALVHTDPGTPVVVRVRREQGLAGARAVVEVVDEGPGMAPDVAAHAFERFYRADPSRSRHRGGSGLGLAIVQATVAAHGGTVELRTAPGAGTTVRIELPEGGPAPA